MHGQQLMIFEHISEERQWQEVNHPLPNGFPKEDRLAVLIEEVGEVGKALNEHDRIELRKELIQVAAVVVRWLELMDGESIAKMRNMNETGVSPSWEEMELYRAAIHRKVL